MSEFITLIAIRGVSSTTILGTLVHLMTQHGHLRLADVLTGASHAPASDREYAIGPGNGWVTIVAPEPYETLAADISRLLGAPVLMFHLHEGGAWLYWFYISGREVDRFDSMPGLWEDNTADEMTAAAGNPQRLADELGADAHMLAPYLTRSETWPLPDGGEYDVVDRALELLDTDARAHPDDRFDVWDARVMYDFMRRLGIDPPLQPDGTPAHPLTLVRFERVP